MIETAEDLKRYIHSDYKRQGMHHTLLGRLPVDSIGKNCK